MKILGNSSIKLCNQAKLITNLDYEQVIVVIFTISIHGDLASIRNQPVQHCGNDRDADPFEIEAF